MYLVSVFSSTYFPWKCVGIFHFVERLQPCLYFFVFNQSACRFILVNFTGETTFEMAGHKSSSFELKIPVSC